MGFDIANYVTAAERVAMFYEKYPDGTIQFEYMGVMDGDPTKMWGVARAYRSADDPLPGVGTASEFIIGKTPYTFGSELQNLETSCWSRAVASLNIGTSKGMSTKEDVVASRQNQAPGPAKPKPVEVVQEPPSDWGIPPEPDGMDDAQDDPWAVGTLNTALDTPVCLHGPMNRRSGTSKKTGKPYAGYFCDGEPQCDPKFDRS
jgi:hypothetical protein